MKKLLLSLLVLVSTSLMASNYPSDYCNNLVNLKTQTPAVFVKISSGCMQNRFVLGYKSNGILNGTNSINAVITVTKKSYSNGLYETEVITKTLQAEWHGNGYMSDSVIFKDLNLNGYKLVKVSIAFSADGKWDSMYGNNYNFNLDDNANLITYKSPNNSNGDVSGDVWDFIVSQMK